MVASKKHREEPDNQNDPDAIPGIHLMTAEEGAALFDRKARELLGISGADFLHFWDAGAYRPVPDTVEGRKISRLVMLMPFAGRTNA